jgi:hypothetical protein
MRYGIFAVAVAASVAVGASAQQPQAGRAGGPAPAAPRPASPWASAPIDLTGNWVSIVNEDWRWRMVTPPKGDYASVPLNDAGRKQADTWTTAQDGSCLAYGAPAVMRNPTRLNISWENENTLKVDIDAGVQTRRFNFDPAKRAPVGPASLQGHSVAEWERPAGGRGGQAPPGGNLKVTTTNLAAGWLRKNGVPYSASASLTEYYDRFAAPNGDEWLVVTTIVADPTYLNQDFVTSTHFKKEADNSKWAPAACKPVAPTRRS